MEQTEEISEKNRKLLRFGNKLLKLTPLWIFILSLIVFGTVAYGSPLTSDDVEFSGYRFEGFGEIFDYALTYGNGRLLGNLGAVLFSRIDWLRIVTRTLTLASLAVLMPYVLGAKKKRTYLLSFIFMITVSPRVFAQVYSWSAGFQNYIPPILMTLAVFAAYRFNSGRRLSVPAYSAICAGVFVAGFCGQLYVEHSTCLNITAAVVLLVTSLISAKISRKSDTKVKGRNGTLLASVYLLSTLAGGVAMFLIPKLWGLPGNRSERYRRWLVGKGKGTLGEQFEEVFGNVGKLNSYVVGGLVLMLVLAGLVILITYRNRKNVNPFLRVLCYLTGVLSLGFYPLNYYTSPIYAVGKLRIDTLLLVLLLICLPAVLFTVRTVTLRTKLSVTLLCLFYCAGILPMSIVAPSGARVTYNSYVFLMMAGLLAYDAAADLIEGNAVKEKKTGTETETEAENIACLVRIMVTACMIAVIVFTSAAFMEKFTEIGRLDRIRVAHYEEQMSIGADEIEYFCINSKYIWVYEDDNWPMGHKWYYEEPDDITFILIEQDEWFAKYGH